MADRPPLQMLISRFAASKYSWLSTVRPDGRCHSTPMWHVWHRGHIYLVTSPTAVKTINIRANPSVVITDPDPKDAIIIEGTAAEVETMDEALRPLFLDKYDWDFATDRDYNTIIEITATKLMAWGGEQGAADTWRWSGDEVLSVADPSASS